MNPHKGAYEINFIHSSDMFSKDLKENLESLFCVVSVHGINEVCSKPKSLLIIFTRHDNM
jgi:hypothetical protein